VMKGRDNKSKRQALQQRHYDAPKKAYRRRVERKQQKHKNSILEERDSVRAPPPEVLGCRSRLTLSGLYWKTIMLASGLS